MSPFVEECRREWSRLGVPDLIADEMASDLEADLAEAQAEGVAPEQLLGGSDPRELASTWAVERGLVSEPKPQRGRRRGLWIVLAIVLFLLILAGAGAVAAISTGGHATPAVTYRPMRIVVAPPAVRVPQLVGLTEAQAERKTRSLGLQPSIVFSQRGHVVTQTPKAGTQAPRGTTVRLRIGRGS